jgi:hypothetical protein
MCGMEEDQAEQKMRWTRLGIEQDHHMEEDLG